VPIDRKEAGLLARQRSLRVSGPGIGCFQSHISQPDTGVRLKSNTRERGYGPLSTR